jgi:hypothetical protein
MAVTENGVNRARISLQALHEVITRTARDGGARADSVAPRRAAGTVVVVAVLAACAADPVSVGTSADARSRRSITATSSVAVKLVPNPLDGVPGQLVQLVARDPTRSNAIYLARAFTWTSSNTAVARVSSVGTVTLLAPGKATVTARVPTTSTTATAAVTVGALNTLIASDDFARYVDSAALQSAFRVTPRVRYAPPIGTSSYLIALDKLVRYQGHATMRYTQPPSPVGTSLIPTPKLPIGDGKARPGFWLRVKMRWMPGYTTDGPTGMGAAYKIIAWFWRGADGTHFDGRGTLNVEDLNRYSIDWRVRMNGVLVGPWVMQWAGHATTEWQCGCWYQYVIHVERTSATTVRTRLWIGPDGTTPTLRATLVGRMAASTPYAAPFTTGPWLGLNRNRAPYRPQRFNYGQWTLYGPAGNPFGVPLP